MVMRSKSGTVRYVEAEHNFNRKGLNLSTVIVASDHLDLPVLASTHLSRGSWLRGPATLALRSVLLSNMIYLKSLGVSSLHVVLARRGHPTLIQTSTYLPDPAHLPTCLWRWTVFSCRQVYKISVFVIMMLMVNIRTT